MRVFEIACPGLWVDLEDKDLGLRVGGYVDDLRIRLGEAATILELFEQAQNERHTRTEEMMNADADAIEDSAERRQFDELTRQMIEAPEKGADFLRDWQVRQRLKLRRQWDGGVVPNEYSRQLPFIYARAFLFAMWTIGNAFKCVAQCEDLPPESIDACNEFHSALPDLKGLRDSSAHVDERIDGKARGKAIEADAIDGPIVKAPAGSVLFVENLLNNRFVGTTADGAMAGIDVSAGTVAHVQRCLQNLILTLPWVGPGRLYPES